MIVPTVAVGTWIWAALDPVLVVVSLALGWRADQAGKIFVAAIAALGVTLLADAALTAIGLPLLAPLSRDAPMLLPVRSVAALGWTAAGYALRCLRDGRNEKRPG